MEIITAEMERLGWPFVTVDPARPLLNQVIRDLLTAAQQNLASGLLRALSWAATLIARPQVAKLD